MFFVYKAGDKPVSFALIMLLIVVLTAVSLRGMDEGETDALNPSSSRPQAEIGSNGTLVIDAGHGGEDGGAVSSDGLHESEVNLEIALRLEALAGLCGVPAVMTRDSAEIDYPETENTVRQRKVWEQKARVELIGGTENAVLISLHQNKFPDSRPRGPQALYAKTDGSKELGETAHENLTAVLYPENRRVAAPASDKIYLMKNVTCPAVLVECGFLSNPEEAALLGTPEYRLKIASVILCSYLEWAASVPLDPNSA